MDRPVADAVLIATVPIFQQLSASWTANRLVLLLFSHCNRYDFSLLTALANVGDPCFNVPIADINPHHILTYEKFLKVLH